MFLRAEGSEKQLHGKLNLTGRRSRGELALVRSVERFGDGAEVRMVRQVERLGPDLQTLAFGHTEVLEKREVHADPSGQRTDVAARAAPEARQRIAERRWVEPLLAVLAPGRRE